MRAPDPIVLAHHLRAVAAQLEAHGKRAQRIAPQLAARGWPTGSDSPIRSADTTSSVEREVLHGRTHWEGVDRSLAQRLRYSWLVTLRLSELVAQITAHGDDTDELPAGSGACQACDRMVRPDLRKGDRLRAGYCEACYRAWDRAGRPERGGWNRSRRQALGA